MTFPDKSWLIVDSEEEEERVVRGWTGGRASLDKLLSRGGAGLGWGRAGTEKCRKTDREGKREHEYEYEHREHRIESCSPMGSRIVINML